MEYYIFRVGNNLWILAIQQYSVYIKTFKTCVDDTGTCTCTYTGTGTCIQLLTIVILYIGNVSLTY